MSDVERIASLLDAAGNEQNREIAIRSYRKALAAWDLLGRDISTFEIVDLVAQVYCGLAHELSGTEREASWQNAMALITRYIKSSDNPNAVLAFGKTAIDYFQDKLTPATRGEKQSRLIEAISLLDTSIPKSIVPKLRSELLAVKSAVLRQKAIIEISGARRKQRLSEAQRCSQLAAIENDLPWISLELQLINLELARAAETDIDFAAQMRAVIAGLNSPNVQEIEAGQFTLAAIYRFTNQPLECCELWANILSHTRRSRSAYRSAYIYAEAAIQLACQDYPEDLINVHLLSASRFTEEALAAGNSTARLITGMAFLTAELAGATQARIVLSDLYKSTEGVNWDEALRLVANEEASEAIVAGLVARYRSEWGRCRLGTFASRHLKDQELSEAFLRTSLRLNPRNAVALTNLARLLLFKGSASQLAEAARLLQRAQNFADRRFFWWREIQRELEFAQKKKQLSIPPAVMPGVSTRNLSDLRRQFRAAKAMEDMQARGYELEKLIHLLAKMTFPIAEPSYRAERVDGLVRQLDGYLEHRHASYRLECKWESSLTNQTQIDIFEKKLDVKDVSGLFISMAGFHKSAIAAAINLRAKQRILLVDGDEVHALFDGRVRFDELLNIKETHLSMRSNPYFRITSGRQVLDNS